MTLNIKRITIVILVLFCSIQIEAQLRKTKVKLVLINGDEKFGYAKRQGTDIYFSKERKKSNKKIVFPISSIKSISYVMKEGYREFNYLKDKRNKYKLMIPLIKGKVNLYKSFERENMSKINNKGDNSYRVSKDGVNYVVFKNFKRDAKKFFSDCDNLVEKIDSREFSRLDLAEIVIIYNDDCVEVKEDTYYTKIPKANAMDSLSNTIKINIPQHLLQEKIVKILRNKVMVDLKPIYFNLDKAELTTESLLELKRVVGLMNRYPKIKIQVGSHTDSRGSTDYNLNLSSTRAQSVVDAIVHGGISLDRIEANGYGESQPTNKCEDGVSCTEKEYKKNRRTEFIIVNPEDLH